MDALVPVKAATQILNPFPLVSLARLLWTHIAPTIAMVAHTTEVGELVPIFGGIGLAMQTVCVQL